MNNLIFYDICEAIFTYNHTVFGEVKYCLPFTLKEPSLNVKTPVENDRQPSRSRETVTAPIRYQIVISHSAAGVAIVCWSADLRQGTCIWVGCGPCSDNAGGGLSTGPCTGRKSLWCLGVLIISGVNCRVMVRSMLSDTPPGLIYCTIVSLQCLSNVLKQIKTNTIRC